MTRYELLAYLIDLNEYTKVAEIGISQGETYQYLSDHCKISEYYAIDPDPKCTQIEGTDLMVMTSLEASELIPNYSLDLVFIDANHSYESVYNDIILWLPKVRKGGILCGHDYENPEHEGVKKAVDEIFGSMVQSSPECYVWMVDV